jgi:5'-deoxynucleotidase YfbR-like HD superfamily hydrolase
MNVVITASGRTLSLSDPDPKDVSIRDIACGLSRINRFSGATMLPVNVADHSLNVVRFLSQRKAPDEIQMLGLLHDAHEAYLGDITSPVRREIAAHVTFDVVQRIAERLDQAIFKAFGIWHAASLGAHAWVRTADDAVFAAEWRDLIHPRCSSAAAAGDAAPFPIKPRSPDKAEEDFLKTFEQLRFRMGPLQASPALSID